jgi:flagellar hook protein FlgE
MKLGTALTTAVSGVQASARILEVSSHNTANAVTDGFVPLDTSLQALASGGVRVRVTRGSGGPDAAEAMAPTGDGTDLVEEVKNQVVGVAAYRANLRSLRASDETEGVLVKMVGDEPDEQS